MTVSATEIADLLRAGWLALGAAWLVRGWLNRTPYRRVLAGVAALVVLDWLLHRAAAWAEQPDSRLPSDFPLYSLIMVGGAAAGLATSLAYAHWRAPRGSGLNAEHLLPAAVLCALAGALGGRAYHVLSHPEYYWEQAGGAFPLGAILEFGGGFGMRGALVAGLVALAVYARWARAPLGLLADSAAVGLTVGSAIGWYGAYLTHTHYGVLSDAWYAQELPDQYGLLALRVPVQLFETALYGALFVLLPARRAALDRRLDGAWRWGRDPYAGQLMSVFLMMAAAGNFLLGFWRGDETLMWQGWRVDQWFDLGLVALGVGLLALQTVLRRAEARADYRRSQATRAANKMA
jgi:prolipoprotein diacylglyceryltransferase